MSSLYFNISIEGTIGAGKTSLANMISANLKAKLILEQLGYSNVINAGGLRQAQSFIDSKT